MSEPTLEKRLLDELDTALRELNTATAAHREAAAAASRAEGRVVAQETLAQRLRMALFALNGTDKNRGDANAANSNRRRELARGES